MKINFDLNVNLWTLIALVIGVFWLFNRGNLKDDIERWRGNYEKKDEALKTYTIGHDNMVAYYAGVIELKQKELDAALKSDSTQRELAKHYRSVATAVKAEQVIEVVDTVEIPIYITEGGEVSDTTVEIWHDCFEVDIGLESGRFFMTNLYIENEFDLVIGDRKKGLWKTEQAFDIRNTNDCIVNTGVTTYNVTVKNHWYEKWWITIPSGFVAGYLVNEFR